MRRGKKVLLIAGAMILTIATLAVPEFRTFEDGSERVIRQAAVVRNCGNVVRSGTCQDLTGNSAASTVGGINIDKTPQILTVAAIPPTQDSWQRISTRL